jgi:hypothetical protein
MLIINTNIPQIYSQRFLVNMTLVKPPRGKPVKRKFIRSFKEKYYSKDYNQLISG